MLLSPSSSSPNFDGVFGSVSSILAESQNIIRRMKLYSILTTYKAMKCDVQSRMMKIWKEAHPQLSESNFRDIVQVSLAKIEAMNFRLSDPYTEVKSLKSLEAAQELLHRYIEDRHYLTDRMVVHSEAGDRGTLIVNYPTSGEANKDHVIKWVNSHEINSTRLYQFFSKKLPNTFSVPEFAQIHLDRQLHITLNKELVQIQEPLFRRLKKNYEELLSIVPRSDQTIELIQDTLQNKILMFSEKVGGEGLFDFINSKYAEMEKPEKEKLFQKIGNLALVDLFLHQNDRINVIKYNKEKSKYELALKAHHVVSEETNLNNLMVDFSEDVAVYAIDNGLEGEKTLQEMTLYTQFLNELFAQENWMDSLSQAIVETFENTLIQFGSSDNEQMFIDDLNSFGIAAIKSGISIMFTDLSLLFQNFQTDELSELLASSPDLLTAISERSNLLLSLRRNHAS